MICKARKALEGGEDVSQTLNRDEWPASNEELLRQGECPASNCIEVAGHIGPHSDEALNNLTPEERNGLREVVERAREALLLIRNRARSAQKRLDEADQHMPARQVRAIGEGALADVAQEVNGALAALDEALKGSE